MGAMYATLAPGAIGVKTTGLDDLLDKAKRHGFGGAEFNIGEAADLIDREGVEAVRARFAGAGVKPAGWFLPNTWREDDDAGWKRDLALLPRYAKAGAALDSRRTFTYIWSCSPTRPFKDNWAFHVDRLTPAARILADHGCRLGLEFLGPKTLWTSEPHEFIHTMERMLDLGAAMGPNAGLLLDCWHWHTSGSTVEALRKVPAEKVVYVHVNDAPKSIPTDALMDLTRCLPGETGVIDIAGFLTTLKANGYDGPVTPEPFKKELNDLPSDDARLKTVAASMQAIFRTAGLV